MALREAIGPDGTAIAYRVTGDSAARPLVLLHGWAASMRCWGDELLADLAGRYRLITPDLRGHGYSDAPADGYDDPENWAADLAAVLAAEGITRDAVLLGWSYGALAVCDYLARRGTAAVAGVIFVGGITGIGRGNSGGTIGSAMRAAIPGVYSEDPRTALKALASFGNANTGDRGGTGVIAQVLFGVSLGTLPRVREGLFRRTTGHDETLRSLDVPALLVHGTADPVVDIASARHAAELLPQVRTSFWDGAQHGPFIEDPARFAADVDGFVAELG